MRLHVWLGVGATVGRCGGGVRGIGRSHGGSVGIRNLGGGVESYTLGGGGAVGTLGSGGAVCTLDSGGEGRPDRLVMAGCTGSANCIILSN